MSHKLLFGVDYDKPLTLAEVDVSRATVAALAFITWDALIYIGTEVDIIWSGQTSLWVRLTYVFMRYVPIIALSSLIVIITSGASHIQYSNVACLNWQIWQAAVTLLLIWIVDAIIILRLYALYQRSKRVLFVALPLYFAEIGIMVYGTVAATLQMTVSPGCLILSAPPTYLACWLSSLAFHTILMLLMAAKYFRRSYQRMKGRTVRVVFRDGTWVYALIFFINLMNSLFYQLNGSPVGGTPYAWAIALYSFAGCRLQMNIHLKKSDDFQSTDSSQSMDPPPLTSHIEMRGITTLDENNTLGTVTLPYLIDTSSLHEEICEVEC